MNDYRVTFLLDGVAHTREITVQTVRHVEAALPDEAEVLEVKFLRARGFSCRVPGSDPRRR